jgi:hypothetical protein
MKSSQAISCFREMMMMMMMMMMMAAATTMMMVLEMSVQYRHLTWPITQHIRSLMITEMVLKTSVQYRHLTQLRAQEDLIKFSHHESSRTCTTISVFEWPKTVCASDPLAIGTGIYLFI